MNGPDWRRIGGVSREAALAVGAVLGTVCLLMLLVGVVFHVKPLVVRSGSMEPTIETGALAMSHTVPARDLRVGDVVSVKTSGGVRVTHRIVDLQPHGASVRLTLRGDANGANDAEIYDVSHAERVSFSVPYAGYVVSWTSGTVGVFLGGLLAGGLLLIGLKASPKKGGKQSVTGVGVVTLVAVSLLHGPTHAEGTLAYFQDAAALDTTGATASSYTVPAPTYNVTCTLGTDSTGQTVAYSWPTNAAPTLGYDINVSGISGATWAITDVGSNKVLKISYATTSVNRNKYVTVTGVGYPSAYQAWKSSGTTTWKFRTNGNNAAATCGEIDAPAVSFSQPLDGTTQTRAAAISALTSTCSGVPACGTRTDASTITSTEFRLERNIGGAITCWAPSTWSSNNCTTAWRTATVSGTGWKVTGTATNAYGSAGTYTLFLQVTDEYGNVASPSITFTLT